MASRGRMDPPARTATTPSQVDPLYAQAMASLKARIEKGDLTAGARLPGERNLAREFSVSQMTMNRALNELVREGVLVRRAGSGTYVREAPAALATAPRITLAQQYDVDVSADYFLGSLWRGMHHAALEDHIEISFARVVDGEYEALIQQRSPDGLLLAYPDNRLLPQLERLRDQGTPFVALGASWDGPDLPCVDSNNRGGVRQAVRYLHRLGHRRLGCVLGAMQTTNSQDRRRGFLDAASEMRVEARPEWMVEGPSSGANLEGGAAEQLQRALLEPDGPTALVCGGYYLALSTYRVVQQLGLRIPQHISVIGFDDPISAAHLQPPLTTLCQPLAEMGARALRKLVAAIRGEAPLGGTEILDNQLVIRSSCATPEAAG